MTHPLLGVRPYPLSYESLSGYLLRLAFLNGLRHICELLSAIGIDKPKARRYGIWSNDQLATLTSALTKALGREFAPSTFPDQFSNGWYCNETSLIKEIRLDFTRICPVCFDDQPVIDWRWALGIVARCNKHGCSLIDTCPNCHQNFELNAGLWDGCYHCGSTWRQLAENVSKSTCLFSPLELALYPDDYGNISAEKVEVAKFCESLLKSARPNDLMWQSLQRIPYSENHSELVLHAIRRIEQPECNLSGSERSEYLRPARRKLCKTGTSVDCRYHVYHRELAKYLKIPNSVLKVVTSVQALPTLNPITKSLSGQIFNTQEVLMVLKSFEAPCIKAGWIIISPETQTLQEHLTSFGNAMLAILNRTLIGCFPLSGDYVKIAVDIQSFKKWLSAQFNDACAGPLSLATVAKSLGFTKIQIMQRISVGHFHRVPQQKTYLVDGKSFRAFVEKTADI